jgi:hypothetical protein
MTNLLFYSTFLYKIEEINVIKIENKMGKIFFREFKNLILPFFV